MPGRFSKQPPIVITAGLAAALLLAAIGWQLGGYRSEHTSSAQDSLAFVREPTQRLDTIVKGHDNWREELALLGIIGTTTRESSTSTSIDLGLSASIAQEFLNGYVALKQSGLYSKERGEELGRELGNSVLAPSGFSLHGESELKLDPDTSLARTLAYRSDMRDALAILINGAPPEFETFARYIETKNPERLRELGEAAQRYQRAENAVLGVVAPQDAGLIHLRVVNALGSFGNSIDMLVRVAESPFESLVVLRTYNEAEREMLYAFDALSSYYVRKSAEKN